MNVSQKIILMFHDLMIKSLKSPFDVQSELSLMLLFLVFYHTLEFMICIKFCAFMAIVNLCTDSGAEVQEGSL